MNGLLKTINIIPALFKRLDDGEKNLIKILSLTVPMAAIITGVVFYYAIQITLESRSLAIVGGLFIGYISFLHDSSMLSERGKGRAHFRLLLSVLFALVLAVPVKVKLMGDSIHSVYLKKIAEYNLDIDDQLLQAKQLVYDEEMEINEQIAEAGKRLDQNGKNTQYLIELRRKKEDFKVTKEERFAQLEKQFEAKKKTEEVSNIELCAFFYGNFFSGTSSAKESLYNAMILLFLLMFESLPALVRLKLDDGKYLGKIEHHKALQKRVETEFEGIEAKIMSGEIPLEALPQEISKVELWSELSNVSQGGYKNLERLMDLAKQVKQNARDKNETPPKKEAPKGSSNSRNNASQNGFPKFDYSDKD